MRIPVKATFARVADDTVDDVILLAAEGWYVVAGLQALMLIFAAAAGTLAGGDVIDPIVSALGGWFLLKTKSRAVAAALLLYGVVTAVLCAAKFLGFTGNGVPLATSIIALYAGGRGLAATRFWQTRACAMAQWNHVAVGAALAFAITLGTFVIVVIAVKGLDLPGLAVEFLVSAVLFLVPVAVLIRFTRRRAFAANDPACPWPPKQ